MQVFTIEPVLFNWWLLCLPFYLSGIALVMWLLPVEMKTARADIWFNGTLVVVCAGGVIVGIIIVFFVSEVAVVDVLRQHMMTALEGRGYKQVSIEEADDFHRFIASYEGQYVEGSISKVEQDTYVAVIQP